ncbi:MAG: hypothetical protein R3335_04780 [Anaerolineales bacterium]|nr:hypothetical protein [Anaerolineales bacterium]
MAKDENNSDTSVNPQSAEDYSRRGWVRLASHENQDAVSDFQQALKLNADLVDAAYGLGKALKASNQSAEAAQAFDKALALLDGGAIEDKIKADMLRGLIIRSRSRPARVPDQVDAGETVSEEASS